MTDSQQRVSTDKALEELNEKIDMLLDFLTKPEIKVKAGVNLSSLDSPKYKELCKRLANSSSAELETLSKVISNDIRWFSPTTGERYKPIGMTALKMAKAGKVSSREYLGEMRYYPCIKESKSAIILKILEDIK